MENIFAGYDKGMGIGGWLTNFKRLHVLDPWMENVITVGDMEHFRSYITESDIANIASFGMDHIRLGFDQIVLEEADKPYCYREEIFGILESFVGWCKKYGLRVVLNLHKAIGLHCDTDDAVSLLDDEELQNRFVALWLELEKRFHSEDIAFELMNEIKDEPEKWNSLASRAIRELRALNPRRKIVVGGAYWNSIEGLWSIDIPHDEYIMYAFHFYEPFEFTHQRGVLQKGPLFYNRDMEYPGDIEKYRDYQRVVNKIDNAYPDISVMDGDYIRSKLAKAVEFSKLHPEKKLWCGEFGSIRHCKTVWRENYMNDIISYLVENGISYCVWNYLSTPNDGNRFSLVDDDNRKPVSDRMEAIIANRI